MSIKDVIDTIESKSGNNMLDYLKTQANNILLQKVIYHALNPFLVYYIKKIPEYESTTVRTTLDEVIDDFLPKLYERKITGNVAIEALANKLSLLSPDEANILERIISKDLRCGLQAKTANKVWKKLVPTYPTMLCSPNKEKFVKNIKYPAIAQTKMDGMRFNAIVTLKESKVEYFGRSGKRLTIPSEQFSEKFLQLAQAMDTGDLVFDGELLVYQNLQPLDRKTGNGIISKSVKGTMSEAEANVLHATLWDCIPKKDFFKEKCNIPYNIRFNDLKTYIDQMSNKIPFKRFISVVNSQEVYSLDEAYKVFRESCEEGQEGIILKNKDNTWENKRVTNQIKFKAELECDLQVVNLQEGTGKYENTLGAIVCSTSDKVLVVSVGSGFDDETRNKVWNNQEEFIEKIVAVKYNAVITNKVDNNPSLFLPIFIEFRTDKEEADSFDGIKGDTLCSF